MKTPILFLSIFLGLNTGAWGSTECESRLTTSIAIVTSRNLDNGKLSAEGVREMIASEVPLNPLRHHAPGVETVRLNDFYNQILALPKTAAEWPIVREELREVLKAHGVSVEISRQASEATAAVMHGKYEYDIDVPKIASGKTFWFRTSRGKTFTVHGDKFGYVQIYDFAARKTVWSGQMSGEILFEELPNGDAFVRAYLKPKRQVRSIDLQSGKMSNKSYAGADTTDEFFAKFLPANPVYIESEHGIAGVAMALPPGTKLANDAIETDLILARRNSEMHFESLHNEPLRFLRSNTSFVGTPRIRQLADGKYVAAAAEGADPARAEYVRYYPPFSDEPTEPVSLRADGFRVETVRILEFQGRVFVSAYGRDGTSKRQVALYEPARSLEPFFKREFARDADSLHFAHRGRFYFVTLVGAKHLEFFEPLKSDTPIMAMDLEDIGKVAGVYVDGDGTPFLASAPSRPSNWKVYSIFQKTRP